MFKIACGVTGLLLLVGGVATTVPAVGDAIQSVTGQVGVTSAITSVTDALSAAVEARGGIDAIKANQAAHQAKIDAGVPLAEANIPEAARAELASQGATRLVECPAELSGLSTMLTQAGGDPLYCAG